MQQIVSSFSIDEVVEFGRGLGVKFGFPSNVVMGLLPRLLSSSFLGRCSLKRNIFSSDLPFSAAMILRNVRQGCAKSHLPKLLLLVANGTSVGNQGHHVVERRVQ